METSLSRVVDRFAGLRVLVIGDALLDRWLHGRTARLCREAPVPVVDVDTRADVPGGAANTAVNLAALGARVSLVAAVGQDPEGEALLAATTAAGVDVDPVVVSQARATATKHRLLASGQLLLRFDQGSTGPLPAALEAAVADRVGSLLSGVDAVVVSDYEAGVRTPAVLSVLSGWAERPGDRPRVCVVDARAPAAWRAVAPTAVTPNYDEAARLLGLDVDDRANATGKGGDRAAELLPHNDRLLDRTGAEIACVTLDAEGAVVLERGQPAYRTYATPAPMPRSTGCGDTYTAALALALAAGAPTLQAAELAGAAAGVVVRKPGTSTCTAAELRADDPAAVKLVPGPAALTGLVRSHRLAGRRIVFTNGCFDLLHRGHVTYLSRAKALGDVLVVAVNADASVRRLKGERRPITSLEDRLEVLAALSCVDHVVAFEEDSPVELLHAARPDVYAKGGDYTRYTLPEAPLVESLGGRVAFLDHLEHRSTSGMLAHITAGEPSRSAAPAAPTGPA